MFCGKRDEFKRGRRTIEKSKNGPVREKSKTAKNKQIEKDRVSTFWYFFVVFDVFFSHFYRFSICLRKTKGKKAQNIVFLLFGFLMFLVFLGFLFDFSRPKTCTDKKIPNVTSNRLRKNGNLDFFSKPWGFLVFQMLKQSDQEREEQLIQQMKDILEAAMVPIVQPWMAENQLNYSMLHSISKK